MKTLRTTLFLALLATSGASAQAGQIWIAPNGNDAAAGTQKNPVATPQKARDLARQQLKAGQRVEVIFQGGDYELAAPLELASEDSGSPQKPVIWRAAQGAKVRLSAGQILKNWRKVSDPKVREKLDAAVRDRVLETDLKAQGITDYGEMSGGFGQSGSTGIELFLNDAPAHIARYPNQGFISISQVLGTTPLDVRGAVGTREGVFRTDDARIARWKDEKDARVLGYWFWDWADERQKIASIEGDKITLREPWHSSGYRKGQYFYGFNLLSEIDEAGEWYLDRETGKLYALPWSQTAPQRAMVSLLPSVLTIKGAKNISFRNLTFEGSRNEAVTMHDCENVTLEGGAIRNCGKYAVFVQSGKNCAVRRCEMTGMGDGGVYVDGGDRATLTPANHVVENCRIHAYSRWNRTYRAAVSLNGVGNRAAHNVIYDAPHQAMNFGGNDHVIEYNEIHNVCQETNDAGAIYGWNDWAARGHRIRFNFIHDVMGHEGRGANGVYLDDNFSSALIEGNIFQNVERPVHIGGGRDHQIVNNLFINCKNALHIDARGLGWRAYGFDELKAKLEMWPYQKAPWSTRYPQLLTLLQDEPMAPKGNLVDRNIMIASTWDDIEDKAEAYVQLKSNDFNAPRSLLKNGRIPNIDAKAPPVRSIGFQPLPVKKMGLQTPMEKRP